MSTDDPRRSRRRRLTPIPDDRARLRGFRRTIGQQCPVAEQTRLPAGCRARRSSPPSVAAPTAAAGRVGRRGAPGVCAAGVARPSSSPPRSAARAGVAPEARRPRITWSSSSVEVRGVRGGHPAERHPPCGGLPVAVVIGAGCAGLSAAAERDFPPYPRNLDAVRYIAQFRIKSVHGCVFARSESAG
jgi:hypothetical protein